MKEKPTLFLMVGLPGSGKTTKAREIEAEYSALRFTPDEWILSLYGKDLNRQQRDAVRDPVEALQWQIGKRALQLGCNVILDFGFWSQTERQKYRQEAESLGAASKVVFQDATLDELWSRISAREESLSGTLEITRSELENWANTFESPTAEELV